MSSFQQKLMRHIKKQEIMACTEAKKTKTKIKTTQAKKTVSEEVQMKQLLQKDFKGTIISMSNNWRKNI